MRGGVVAPRGERGQDRLYCLRSLPVRVRLPGRTVGPPRAGSGVQLARGEAWRCERARWRARAAGGVPADARRRPKASGLRPATSGRKRGLCAAPPKTARALAHERPPPSYMSAPRALLSHLRRCFAVASR